MKRNHLIVYTIILLTLLGSSCKVGRNYQRPEVQLPGNFSGNTFADTSSMASISWEKFFADTALQSLISRGLKYNYNLQIAIKRIDIAKQQLRQARLSYLPQVNLQVAGQYTRPSDNSLTGLSTSSFLGTSHIENYNANLGLSWEADVWGKIRRQKEGALAQYLETFEASRAVQTELITNMAQGYYNLLMLDKQLQIARRNLHLSDSTLKLTQLLKNAGEANQLAVQQADAQRQATALLIPQLEQSITVQETALQQLAGQLPGHINRNTDLEQATLPTDLRAGVPAALLSRRPDIRASEMALVAANARTGVAQANLYPSLVLTATGGLESFKASNWFSIPGSVFGIASGSVLQPVLRGRALRTQFEVAKTQREQAALQFRESVLNAVGEVTNSLAENDRLQQQQKIALSQVGTSRSAIKNAQLLFKSDMANYLEVLSAQSAALQAELNLASIQRQQLAARIELYRALGGGWSK